MSVSYDVFIEAFLSKITEYEFIKMDEYDREALADGYMKRAIASFKKNCMYDLSSTANDEIREFDVSIESEDLDEIVDIISEGMLIHWMKPYLYRQELLENVLNTRDYTTYSPAELLKRVGDAYKKCQQDYTQMVREYSYNHGDLTRLHI